MACAVFPDADDTVNGDANSDDHPVILASIAVKKPRKTPCCDYCRRKRLVEVARLNHICRCAEIGCSGVRVKKVCGACKTTSVVVRPPTKRARAGSAAAVPP